MKFSRGGWQEARGGGIGGNGGRGHPQDYFVENVFEELDAESEYFHDRASALLYFIPPANTSAPPTVYVDQMPRVIQFRGSEAAPVQHITLRGFNVTHASPTYLQSYEVPSGGDWSIHRFIYPFMGTSACLLEAKTLI